MTTTICRPSQESPLDESIFAGLMELVDGDDTSFVEELFESYVGSYRECVDGIRAAIDAGDPDAMKRHAHTLKGSSANVGAAALSEFARALQEMGEAGSVEGASAYLEAIEAEYPQVLAAVAARIPSFTPPA